MDDWNLLLRVSHRYQNPCDSAMLPASSYELRRRSGIAYPPISPQIPPSRQLEVAALLLSLHLLGGTALLVIMLNLRMVLRLTFASA